TSEQHGPIGNPDHYIVGGMGRRANVVQLDSQVVDPYGQVIVECHKRRRRMQVAPVDLGPDSSRWWKRRAEDLLAALRVADDRRQRQQAITEGFSPVMMWTA